MLSQHAVGGIAQAPEVLSPQARLELDDSAPSPFCQQFIAFAAGVVVPLRAGRVVLEPRPRVDQHQGADAIRVLQMEGKRHVTAQRHAADHSLVDAAGIQQGIDVADSQISRIECLVIRRVGLAVPRASTM